MDLAPRAAVAGLVFVIVGGSLSPTRSQPACEGSFEVAQVLDGPIAVQELDFSSPDDGWGVGFQYESEEGSREFAYVVRYDGESWQIVPAPPRPRRGILELNSVSALSPNHVWVSGFRSIGRDDRTYVSFWDGVDWARAETPSPGVEATIRDIQALASDDVWAVGYFERRSGEVESLTLNFDGASWTRVDTPSPGYITALMDLGASSSNDVWAVGSRSSPHRAFTIRYDGHAWTPVELPDYMKPRRNESSLDAVHAVAPGDVWMVGHRGRRRPGNDAVALHWDGAWQVTFLPSPRGHESAFDIDAARTDSVWAVGWRFVPERAYPYAARWDGAGWTQVDVPNSNESGVLEAIAFDGQDTMWATGSHFDEDVIERACVP